MYIHTMYVHEQKGRSLMLYIPTIEWNKQLFNEFHKALQLQAFHIFVRRVLITSDPVSITIIHH